MLHMLCGKIGAGKSTLAKALAAREATVLISEDAWLAALFGDRMETGADSCTTRRSFERSLHRMWRTCFRRACPSCSTSLPTRWISARGCGTSFGRGPRSARPGRCRRCLPCPVACPQRGGGASFQGHGCAVSRLFQGLRSSHVGRRLHDRHAPARWVRAATSRAARCLTGSDAPASSRRPPARSRARPPASPRAAPWHRAL
jgi:hypothetical protein